MLADSAAQQATSASGQNPTTARLPAPCPLYRKVGFTSKEAQRLLGTSEPGSGPILGPYLHMSPGRVAIVPLQMPAVGPSGLPLEVDELVQHSER
jgi:hypothetical protein